MYQRLNSTGHGTYSLFDYPEECPECHNKIIPILCSHRVTSDKIYSFLNCPNPNCNVSFSAEYQRRTNQSIYDFLRIIKGKVITENFSAEILHLSEAFVKIYNEAYFTEQNNLLEISGVGYRKALEFLIKDYLIDKRPELENEIKSKLLGKCIEDYVDDTRIKETAKRAAWLGNDHTHYVKKWEGKDLSDLKLLIKLSVNWIESELMTEQFVNGMN